MTFGRCPPAPVFARSEPIVGVKGSPDLSVVTADSSHPPSARSATPGMCPRSRLPRLQANGPAAHVRRSECHARSDLALHRQVPLLCVLLAEIHEGRRHGGCIARI